MGRKQSLQNQACTAIKACFKPHMDKHAHKTKSGFLEPSEKVWSFSSRKNLTDFAKNAFSYIKAEFPELRQVKDVQVEHFNAFLESKTSTCSSATINLYTSYIGKLSLCINKHYRVNTNWSDGIVKPKSEKTPSGERLRNIEISPSDYNDIINESKKRRSNAVVALEIAGRIGTRVDGASSLTANDINLDREGKWGFGKVDIIKEKGGRCRSVDIQSAEDREYFQNLKERHSKHPDKPMCNITKDSVNRQLRRVMEKLGIQEKYGNGVSVHGIRKMWAQRTWDKCIANGMTRNEAIKFCNEQLGHNKKRDAALLALYVSNMN